MNEEYLWDKSGEPDEEIVRLEAALGELKWAGAQRVVPGTKMHPQRQRTPLWIGAVAAVLLIGVGTAVFVQRMHVTGPMTSWNLSLGGGEAKAVRAGEVIETASGTRGTMESKFVGEVQIEPDSQLRLMAARDDEQRLSLDHGTIHAFIWAPPAKFVVDTPSAHAVDLGCQYTLRVARDGTGFLTVEMGWVAFDWHNVESFIPAGAACTTRRLRGPGTPYFLDAPKGLTTALDQFDSIRSGEALKAALSFARPRDGLTLWHLLGRTQGEQRAAVLDRFVAEVELPSVAVRRGILAGDQESMDAAWDALQLGNTSWWREWKRRW